MKYLNYKLPEGYFAFIDLFFPENRYAMSNEEKLKYDAILKEYGGDQREYDISLKTIDAFLIGLLPAEGGNSSWGFLSNITVQIPVNRVYWED